MVESRQPSGICCQTWQVRVKGDVVGMLEHGEHKRGQNCGPGVLQPAEWYWVGIENLAQRWLKAIKHNGSYSEDKICIYFSDMSIICFLFHEGMAVNFCNILVCPAIYLLD